MYNGSYQRVGEADIRLTKYEIDRLLENRSQPRYDRGAGQRGKLQGPLPHPL